MPRPCGTVRTYTKACAIVPMLPPISLTELRQRLFQLADQVVDTGEALVVLRRGVRLRLSREEPAQQEQEGRLQRLREQVLVLGPALAADESPAAWSETATPVYKVAESAVAAKRTRRVPRK